MSSSEQFVYRPEHFLGWALRSGWSPSAVPRGVVYTFQSPVARALADQSDRFSVNTELTVSNATVLMTGSAEDLVLIACLNPGAASMVTQLEHLRFLLGDRPLSAIIAGTAGALTGDHKIGDTVVVDSALRTDGISDWYLPVAPTVDADQALTAELATRLGGVPLCRSWTVPVPYRSTRARLMAARQAGARVVEMEAASLFAAGQALDVRTGAVVVISDIDIVDEPPVVEWSDTLQPTLAAIDVAIDVIRNG